MSRVVFVESRPQAARARELADDSDTVIVALSGEALQALEELGVQHRSVSSLVRGYMPYAWDRYALGEVVRLLAEIEEFIARRDGDARLAGVDFLSSQAYYVLYAVLRAGKRSLLMIEAARSLRATHVATFAPPSSASADWAMTPWLAVLAAAAPRERFDLELLDDTVGARASAPAVHTDLPLIDRLGLAARRRLSAIAASRSRRRDARSLRLLFLPSPRYDWGPVIDALQRRHNATCHWLDGGPLERSRGWTRALGNVLRTLGDDEGQVIAAPFERRPADEARYAALFDEWARERVAPPRLEAHGVDLFPGVAAELREIAAASPALCLHADEVANRALDATEPHAVCFFALAWLPAIRLARAARRRGIPTVSYQHGGAYGTHRFVTHDVSDWRHADHFLTYGAGVAIPPDPVVAPRARITPVGSAVIEGRRPLLSRPRGRLRRVLWVSDYATLDTDMYHLDRETWRYALERRCLEALGRGHRLRVTYRPFPSSELESGIVRWLEGGTAPAIAVDRSGFFPHLVQRADVVVTDTISGTVCNEVLGWRKPLVLITDLPSDRLDPDYAAELDRACWWCRDLESAAEAITLLTDSPRQFAAEMARRDSRRFVERYVLHHGRPVADALSFFDSLPRATED